MTQIPSQNNLPITERQNELTLSIDLSSNLFQDFMHVDQQMFTGYKNFRSIYSFEKELVQLSSFVQQGNIAMSGCGTSGRIAWLCARAWNKYLKENHIEDRGISYLIAGGDTALIRAEEVAEDDINAKVPPEFKSLVGITCGLSAPYVAGQCRYMVENNKNAIIIGFNPLNLARERPIFLDTNSKIHTFKDMLQFYENEILMINPILGAEAITGSTRMKGGSATKLLLDAAFIKAQNQNIQMYDILFEYETAFRYTYHPKYYDKMNRFIKICGDGIKQDGHIYYLGFDTAGLLAIIDASECVPTFGANFDDIRGFVVDGWKTMQNKDGDLSSRGEQFCLGMDHFVSTILPNLTKNDTIIFLYIDAYSDLERNTISKLFNETKDLLSKLSTNPQILTLKVTDKQSKKDLISVFGTESDNDLIVEIPKLSPIHMHNFPTFGELSMKFLLNAISTGAHIEKGTVFSNQMINVRVSNNKLFYRAIGIISKIGKVDALTARKCLLQSIYCRENNVIPQDSDDNSIVERHIRASIKHSYIVPVAILLSHGLSMNESLQILQNNPRIRKVILDLQVLNDEKL